ncbi:MULTISPECIES: DUF4253 domain-containing protein [Streptomyces]|uniref:DUF4253 domain-containing protein n=1 Tax=Streptomyces viridochromogenes TaxID=1938 RepID=A0A0L8LAJ6_STRVR|nr:MULTISPECIES: DUF4253 domain-containing protein [Streptomyces]KOG35086.1 hypothetical protein ADK34_05750 [Streptomyces viridochromogenes]
MAMIPNQLPRLMSDPTGRSLGLDLPPGALTGPAETPYLWSGHAPAGPAAWAALRPAARTAGLLPVLLGVERNLDEWQLQPERMSDPADHDADEVLAGFWGHAASETPEEEQDPRMTTVVDDPFGEQPERGEIVAPFTAGWPGLAAAQPLDTDPDRAAATVAEMLTEPGFWLDEARPALVPARRSADIPAVIGWGGPLNHENDVARLCTVLRSWEDRFGARVIALTFDQLVVSVAAPPKTLEEAEAVAAEHFAFCPDNIAQGSHGTLREYAEKALLDAPVWSFWWD